MLQRELVLARSVEESCAAIVGGPPPEPTERAKRHQLVEIREPREVVDTVGGSLRDLQNARVGRTSSDAASCDVECHMPLSDEERRTRHVRRDDGSGCSVRFRFDELYEVLEGERGSGKIDEIESEGGVVRNRRDLCCVAPRCDGAHPIVRKVPERGSKIAPGPSRSARSPDRTQALGSSGHGPEECVRRRRIRQPVEARVNRRRSQALPDGSGHHTRLPFDVTQALAELCHRRK